jgi:hypothetical protein
MIWLEWKDPNFEFDAVDGNGKAYSYFCYAESEPKLRQRLAEKGLEVIDVRPYDFSVWQGKARKAKEAAIADHLANVAQYTGNIAEDKKKRKPIRFKPEIWGELKWHLFSLSYDKCAYCESKVRIVDFGDVDHFRPKSKVEEDPLSDDDLGHPGYYWLAYDVTNLLPACGLCNRPPGKSTHFPVEGAHAREPAALANEQPLFLDPYNHTINPFEHLEFNSAGAAIPHKNSPYAESSMRHFRLNRYGIGEERRTAINQVQMHWSALVGIYSSIVLLNKARKTYWDEVLSGIRPYSAAQRWELQRITAKGGI